MTKKEIISKLVEQGFSKEELKDKSLNKLKELLGEVDKKEDTAEEKGGEDKKEERILESSTHQLGIFTEYIYHVRNKGAKVRVENLGYGDAYVNVVPTKVGEMENRIVTGKSKEFEGADIIYMVAASQPVMRITELG